LKNKWFAKIREWLSSREETFKHHARLLQAIIGVVYFLLFTALLSSSLFADRLQLKVGEPSPQLITAPRDKDIEDLEKYKRDQEAAVIAVQPVYKADETFMEQFIEGINTVFAVLRAAGAFDDESVQVAELQKGRPFSDLASVIVAALLKISPEALLDARQLGTGIILNRASNGNTGARTDSDVASLRDEVKADIGKSILSDEIKQLFVVYVEQNLNRPTLTVDEENTARLREAARESVVKEFIHFFNHLVTPDKYYEYLVKYRIFLQFFQGGSVKYHS